MRLATHRRGRRGVPAQPRARAHGRRLVQPRAHIAAWNDDLAGSERACREALALDPDHGPATHNLALALIWGSAGSRTRHRSGAARDATAAAGRAAAPDSTCSYLLVADAPAQAVAILRAWLGAGARQPVRAAPPGRRAPARARPSAPATPTSRRSSTASRRPSTPRWRACTTARRRSSPTPSPRRCRARAPARRWRRPRLRHRPVRTAAEAVGEPPGRAATSPTGMLERASRARRRTTSCARPNSPPSCARTLARSTWPSRPTR